METPLNQEVERIIRESLAETRSRGWSDDDRRRSAGGAALKYLKANSDLDRDVQIAVAGAMVAQIMQEEQAMRPCPYCGAHHPIKDLDAGWHCPMEPDPS